MDIRWIRWIALACIVLLVSSVSAVPYQASESVKDYLDTDALAKSLTVDIIPTLGPDGKPTVGVTLGSTDARYQALNGKSFTIDPTKTDGGVDVAVDAKGAGIDHLLSGKSVHIPRNLDGMDINDPAAIDTPAFDSIAQSEVTGLVADTPVARNMYDRFVYWCRVLELNSQSHPAKDTTYRALITDTVFATDWASPPMTGVTAALDGTPAKQKQSWWQWTKNKCKAAWKTTKEFVKEHWVAILVFIIVLIIVAIIMLILFHIFGPAAAPATPHIWGVSTAQVMADFAFMSGMGWGLH